MEVAVDRDDVSCRINKKSVTYKREEGREGGRQ